MNAAQKKLAIAYLRDVLIPDFADVYECRHDRGVACDDELMMLLAMRAAVRALSKVKATKEKRR